ncbi:MAG: sulfurtransferase-like selenium metabolism protein YedF [Desulforhopalus sp.]
MGKTIDACGLTCPAPVLLVKDAVEQTKEQKITVLVDNAASLENVSRFLASRGFSVSDTKEGEVFKVEARGGGETTAIKPAEATTSRQEAEQKILVLVASNTFGTGDDALGEKLMIAYIKTIKEIGPDLWQLIFINGGVKLTTESSPVLPELLEYEKSGVTILACGTCLEHFNLTSLKRVGGTTNMLDIVTATQLADKVITIG